MSWSQGDAHDFTILPRWSLEIARGPLLQILAFDICSQPRAHCKATFPLSYPLQNDGTFDGYFWKGHPKIYRRPRAADLAQLGHNYSHVIFFVVFVREFVERRLAIRGNTIRGNTIRITYQTLTRNVEIFTSDCERLSWSFLFCLFCTLDIYGAARYSVFIKYSSGLRHSQQDNITFIFN